MVDLYNFRRTHTFHDNERAHPVLETLWYPGKGARLLMGFNLEGSNMHCYETFFSST